ncbi:MAG TPA: HEAT repeat domain-containing protein [Sedimentisphaerales bacterium]|nr:HEAT repeat domain-containing protein [Sedimentisphaerales bacterium]
MGSKQPLPQKLLARRILLGTVIIGLLSLGYHVFDLAFPNTFVGDMYGLEVMARLFHIIVASIAILLGVGLLTVSRKKQIEPLGAFGKALILISCLAYVVMGVSTAYSRWQWRIRDSYPRRSVEELLSLAREKKDQFAIDALLIKKDRAAVPGLSELLLDEHQEGWLRGCAAHALGEIGGQQAREALEEVLARHPEEHLKMAVEYALQTRMGIAKPVPDSNKIVGGH